YAVLWSNADQPLKSCCSRSRLTRLPLSLHRPPGRPFRHDEEDRVGADLTPDALPLRRGHRRRQSVLSASAQVRAIPRCAPGVRQAAQWREAKTNAVRGSGSSPSLSPGQGSVSFPPGKHDLVLWSGSVGVSAESGPQKAQDSGCERISGDEPGSRRLTHSGSETMSMATILPSRTVKEATDKGSPSRLVTTRTESPRPRPSSVVMPSREKAIA